MKHARMAMSLAPERGASAASKHLLPLGTGPGDSHGCLRHEDTRAAPLQPVANLVDAKPHGCKISTCVTLQVRGLHVSSGES